MKLSSAAVVATAVAMLGMHDALACTDAAIAEVAKHGVARDAIGETYRQRQSQSEGGTQGYLIWLKLRGCQGYAVVETDTGCNVMQLYTTKDCHIKGVSNY